MADPLEQIFGDFQENVPDDREYLTLVFSPANYSLKQRWRNNSLSAGFMGEYFANFFPGPDNSTLTVTKAEVKSVIKYIANELLENTVKFHHDPLCKISLTLHLEQDQLLFNATNSVDPATVGHFQQWIGRLLQENVADLYLQQLEENAADVDNTSSGLGLITLVNDYQARLGWKFEHDEKGVLIVTTQVQVPLMQNTNEL